MAETKKNRLNHNLWRVWGIGKARGETSKKNSIAGKYKGRQNRCEFEAAQCVENECGVV